jgi:hypothetical protein
MFVDCASKRWYDEKRDLMSQVTVFPATSNTGPPLPPLMLGGGIAAPRRIFSDPGPPKGHEREGAKETREVTPSPARRWSAPDPIPRPHLDFQKARERLAGLKLADHGMGLRLHVPEKRIIKF